MKNKVTFLSLFIAGCLYPLGFAPIAMPGLTILSLAFLYYHLNVSSDAPFKKGFTYGFGKYSLGVSWIYMPINNLAHLPVIISIILTIFFIVYLSLFEGLATLIFSRIRKKNAYYLNMFYFAAIETLIEISRSILLTGFPWLILGYISTTIPLKFLAPIVGSFGLSFIIYSLASILASAILNVKKQYHYYITFIGVFLFSGLFSYIHWTKPTDESLKVSLIQGNINHLEKWSARYFEKLFDTYQKLTSVSWGSDLIVWPETALPLPNTDLVDLLNYLESNVKTHNAYLALGMPYEHKVDMYTNAMMILGDKKRQLYEKEHLVPFGEYQPLTFLNPIIKYLGIPFPNMQPGSIHQHNLKIHHFSIAPLICYEVAFSEILRRHLPGANLLMTISDDSWYDHSWLKSQHLQIAQMRSLESGRMQLFETNDGISAIINAQGDLISSTKDNTNTVLQGVVHPFEGITPWVLIGDKGVSIVIFLLLFCIFFYEKYQKPYLFR